MYNQDWHFKDGDTTCYGHLAYDDGDKSKRPVVMLVPAFEGLVATYHDMAQQLAAQGYMAAVVDMYGEGRAGHDLEECLGLMMPLMQDRAALRVRIVAAYEALSEIEVADTDQVAIMGFCFGGMVALDLARAGVAIKGAVSIHGALAAPEGLDCESITAKILVLHGYQDPQIPPEAVVPFAAEMQAADTDWQLHFFGSAKHAFTDPDADAIGDASMGRVYDKVATDRSWRLCFYFFNEIFS